MPTPTPAERLLIRRVIADPVFTAEFYTSPEGVAHLISCGRSLEALLARSTDISSTPPEQGDH